MYKDAERIVLVTYGSIFLSFGPLNRKSTQKPDRHAPEVFLLFGEYRINVNKLYIQNQRVLEAYYRFPHFCWDRPVRPPKQLRNLLSVVLAGLKLIGVLKGIRRHTEFVMHHRTDNIIVNLLCELLTKIYLYMNFN